MLAVREEEASRCRWNLSCLGDSKSCLTEDNTNCQMEDKSQNLMADKVANRCRCLTAAMIRSQTAGRVLALEDTAADKAVQEAREAAGSACVLARPSS